MSEEEHHGETMIRKTVAASGGLVLTLMLTGATTNPFTKNQKARYADPSVVAFVRPGLVFKIQSAQIASDGTISTVFTITDPNGAPLDRDGIVTPGAVSTSFIAAYIPANQSQYVAYTTRSASGAVVPSTQQASADSGGTYTRLADGQYRYTFATKAPSGFPTTVTHTIGIYGNRNLLRVRPGHELCKHDLQFRSEWFCGDHGARRDPDVKL